MFCFINGQVFHSLLKKKNAAIPVINTLILGEEPGEDHEMYESLSAENSPRQEAAAAESEGQVCIESSTENCPTSNFYSDSSSHCYSFCRLKNLDY